MRIIFLLLLIVIYNIVNKNGYNFIKSKSFFPQFKIKVVLTPLQISIALLFILLMDLSLTKVGFSSGNINSGLKSIVFIGVPLALICAGLVFFIPIKNLKEVKYGDKNVIWEFLYVWIFVGPVEEIFYRGFVQGCLSLFLEEKIFLFSYATIISSCIFVLVHIFNVLYNNETWQEFLAMLPTRFIIGLVLGYSMQISNSLLYPIIIHNLIDGLNLSSIYFRKQKLRKKM